MKGWLLLLREELVSKAIETDLWPVGETWWFGWNEGEIRLPTLLKGWREALAEKWEVLRIFSPKAELRQERRGRQVVFSLLVEEEAYSALPPELKGKGDWFLVEKGYHLLAGEPRGGRWVKTQYPRYLDYGVAGNDDAYVVVRVYKYRDRENPSFSLVRYAGLVLVPKKERDQEKWQLKPYGG
ncbi:hypothetical protein [Ammonifex thiophilus]|uniref:Uncharacterized protein n=1 Tax=Ammonifex thiophilus TaxID=444093 RepID=A0A3D8P5J9_9THEO|nr:hypothetical protein [Ammonifex thiophilus]RDV83582.1 hypothetical protein DXX99_04600 [Ammonifex thiophilus]